MLQPLFIPFLLTTTVTKILSCLLPLSGHVSNMAVNEWGHAVLCTALSVVDDTALVSKTVVAELKVCAVV